MLSPDDDTSVLYPLLLARSHMLQVPVIIKPMIKRIIPMPTVVKSSSSIFSVFRI
jgi:hypothetical protein